MESNVTANGGSQNLVIAPEKPGLKIILSVISSIIAAVVGYYLYLPALNPKAIELWLYLAGVVLSFVFFLSIFAGATKNPEYGPYVRSKSLIPVILTGVIAVIALVGYLVGAPLFRAKDYSQLLNVVDQAETDFVRDIKAVNAASITNIPHMDEESARQLANRALSDLGDTDTVSQYTVFPMYTQINYKEKPVRVVPLQYASIIKWLTNTGRGLPGYIIVDMASQEKEFHRLEGEYIRYSPAEHFGRLLKRHLRFQHPTYLLGDSTFEIDDEGNPYWITPRYDNKLGLFGGKDVIGAIITKADSKNGESFDLSIDELRTEEKWQWIDRVFDSQLLVRQYNYAGKYHSGFWNSLLGQKGVRMATEGYNYIAKDDDVFLYTGVTSVTADQSIIGFLLINQRTKAASFYSVGGATEYSAMSSAEGIVADKGYKATFPILINVAGQPTYFMALKDVKNNAQIVQQFALVNVSNFNKIRVSGETVSEVFGRYLTSLKENGVASVKPEDIEDAKGLTLKGKIVDIQSAVVGGTSYYYFLLDVKEFKSTYFRISAADFALAPLLKAGQTIEFIAAPGPGANDLGVYVEDIIEMVLNTQ